MRMRLRVAASLLSLVSCLAFASCRSHNQPDEHAPLVTNNYIDLQPGWRIRVVSPLLSSGGFKVNLEQVQSENGSISLKTGKDFQGYETDLYVVRSSGDTLQVRFSSGLIRHNDGTEIRSSAPLPKLFDLPDGIRYVRLLFLVRVSQADHNQAILAAPTLQQLDSLMRAVENDPMENCKVHEQEFCSWVPDGVSVQPEKKSGRIWGPAA